jgi:hypothetical protein
MQGIAQALLFVLFRRIFPARAADPSEKPLTAEERRTYWGPSPIREETYGSALGAMLTPVNWSFLAIGSRMDGAVPLLLMGRAAPPSRRRRGDRPPGRRVFRWIRGECRRGENPASETDGPGAFSLRCGRRPRCDYVDCPVDVEGEQSEAVETFGQTTWITSRRATSLLESVCQT